MAHFSGGTGSCVQYAYATETKPITGLDQTASNTTLSGAVCGAGTTPTTTNANDYVLAMCAQDPDTTTLISGPTNGFFELADPAVNEATAAYFVTSTTGAQSTSWTRSASLTTVSGAIAAYKLQ